MGKDRNDKVICVLYLSRQMWNKVEMDDIILVKENKYQIAEILC